MSSRKIYFTAVLLLAGSLLLASTLIHCSTGSASAESLEANSVTFPFTVRRDVVYAEATDELQLLADVYLPQTHSSELRPAVLVIHGGSWQRGNRERMQAAAGALARAGFVAMNIEYRLAPDHRHPAQLEDCRTAVRWLREHAAELNIDANRIGAIGYSAGAHLALLLALHDTGPASAHSQAAGNDRIQAVVAGAAPCDLTAFPENAPMQRLLGASLADAPDLYRLASPITHVSPDDPPVFLYHGRYDWVVPVQQTRKLVESLRQAGVHVESYESEQGHLTSAVNNEVELERAVQFLRAWL